MSTLEELSGDQKMRTDPIIEELHQIRAEHAASFNYDIAAIIEDLRERDRLAGKSVVSFPPRLLNGDGKTVTQTQNAHRDIGQPQLASERPA